MKYRAKHVAEYLLVRTIAAVLAVLPYAAALAVGWLIAALGFYVIRSRVATAIERIQSVLGSSVSPRQARRIAWQSWRNTVFNAVELLRVRRITQHWLRKIYDCDRFLQVMHDHLASGRGAIIACSHMGNWEMAAINSHLNGIPIFSIAGTQKNPLLNSYINKMRARPGIDIIERGSGTMRQVVKRLKNGKVLAILPDVRVRTEGVAMPFLGGTANLGAGMGAFACMTGAPVFVCILAREGWMRHRITIHPAITPDLTCDRDAEITRITRDVMAIIDSAIRSDPGQWFWYNKRWVLDPYTRKA